MALLNEEDVHNHQNKRSNKGAEGGHSSEPETHVWVCNCGNIKNFGDHVLCRLASNFLNVIR